jgi:hypothetical protein
LSKSKVSPLKEIAHVPDEVDTLIVVGQRRTSSSGPFPAHPEPVRDPEPDGSVIPTTPSSPCDDPFFKTRWNSDSAAAEARRRIMAAAAAEGQYVAYRERTFVIYRLADGSIGLGPMGEGAPMTGASPVITTDIPSASIIGFIHNHPAGTTWPSVADFNIFNAMMNAVPESDRDGMSYYIIGPDPECKIYSYDKNAQAGVSGPEVNPNATIC